MYIFFLPEKMYIYIFFFPPENLIERIIMVSTMTVQLFRYENGVCVKEK